MSNRQKPKPPVTRNNWPGRIDVIKSAASTVAYGMMKYYTGNHTGGVPGNLPEGYYWWECGAMFMSLMDYWYYTGDSTYNDITTQGMLFQVGPDQDYVPPNQTKTEGNDDQAFWGMAAMAAAEQKFPDPPPDQPQWLALAQAVFNSQAARWDETCDGGLRWQINAFNNGYNYKNAIANGCFFNIGARLAVYTGNQSYAEWAGRTWDWSKQRGLISDSFEVFDGTDANKQCTSIDHDQWSYNFGTYLLGAAHMYNFTDGSDQWKQRIEGLLKASNVFFKEEIMYEFACEPQGTCNSDRKSFKAYTARWMAAATKLAPFVSEQVMSRLRTSAVAAAQQCSGGTDGVTCGMRWTQKTEWDGYYGIGEQMSALQVIQSLLIGRAPAPVTSTTGGTSKGDVGAGNGSGNDSDARILPTITSQDRVGAGFLTCLTLAGVLAGTWWVVV
ncbi:MAG: hydrolase 76 protein [Sclerophora amabilis]|nr:MAG: hydrolase 76 protein [Sclerophora amabilis]